MFNIRGCVLALLITGLGHASAAQQAPLHPYAPVTGGGNIRMELGSERTFLLNVPEAYTPDKPHPLVLTFHGAGGSSDVQQQITQLSDPALRIAGLPFLTAYGQGVNNTDVAPPMHHVWKGAPYANKTADDIAYVHDMIAAIGSLYHIDRARIYACGKSNGGGFAALLACRADTSQTIAAIAPVAPALYEGTHAFHGCAPARPVPMLHVHGVLDPVTPLAGRRRRGERGTGGWGRLRSVRGWRRAWAVRNGCARGRGPHRVAEVHPGAWEEVWACEGAEVRALTVATLGHAWPTTEGRDSAGAPHHWANFDFTSQHLVPFFSNHSLDSR